MPGSAELEVDESAVDVHADAFYMHLVADRITPCCTS